MSRHENPAAPAALGSRVRTAVTGTRTRAVLSLGIVLGLGAVGTLAAWSDSATATSGVFSTGSIKIALAGDNPSHNFATLTSTKMMPGTSVAATLPVQNTGVTDFNYGAKVLASGGNDLAQFLDVKVFTGASTNGKTCTGGTEVGAAAMSSGTAVDLISTPRGLVSGAEETLCFQVQLNQGVTMAAQGQEVQAAFEFVANAS